MKNILTTLFLFLFVFVVNAQKAPKNVLWGEKLKQTKNLSDFIYKNNELFTVNFQLKAIQKFSPDKLELLKTIELEGKMGTIEGQSINIFESMQSLIEYKEGFGILVAHTSKEKKKKYFGFFQIDANLSNIESKAILLFEMDLGKKEEYQNSRLVLANENYQGVFSSKNQKVEENEIFAQLDIVGANGKVFTKDFFKKTDDDGGEHFTFCEEAFLIHEWTETSSDLSLYSGLTTELISTFSLKDFLEHDGRVISMKKTSKGEYILAGFYGDFSDDENEIMGLFRVKLSATGKIIEKGSDTFLMSEITTTQQLGYLSHVLITDKEDLYFVLTSSSGQLRGNTFTPPTAYEQLMVIGIHVDEIWTKSIPFRQGYGSIAWPDHLGPIVNERNGHLILSFNDHKKNGKNFDYNHYEYSEKTRPDKYICSSPDVITMIDINPSGSVKPVFIDVYDIFVNLTETITLEDGTMFISGNAATVAGAGKARFAKVTLE